MVISLSMQILVKGLKPTHRGFDCLVEFGSASLLLLGDLVKLVSMKPFIKCDEAAAVFVVLIEFDQVNIIRTVLQPAPLSIT